MDQPNQEQEQDELIDVLLSYLQTLPAVNDGLQLDKAKMSGNTKRSHRCTVTVVDVSRMLFPQNTFVHLQPLKEYLNALYFFQYSTRPEVFDVFFSFKTTYRRTCLERVVNKIVSKLCGGDSNISRIVKSCNSTRGTHREKEVKFEMLQITGCQQVGQLITFEDIPTLKSISTPQLSKRRSQKSASKGLPEDFTVQEPLGISNFVDNQDQFYPVVICSNGAVFDVKLFVNECIVYMQNGLTFCENTVLADLQRELNRHRKWSRLRLFDYQPFLNDLWRGIVLYVAQRNPSLKEIAHLITPKQIQVLQNSFREPIVESFCRFVIGKDVVQPHPVRALVDHIPNLMNECCFEFGLYDFQYYGINLLVTSFYLAKNFLTADEYITNEQGSMAFIGASGSGKSCLVEILQTFFNGYLYQHLGKGVTEFQNYEITESSFMRAEEVKLEVLATDQWKMLGDITSCIKCHIKNSKDVQVKKNVPMVITSNSDIRTSLLQHLSTDENFVAAHRRWGYIRYFKSWAKTHCQLYDRGMGGYLAQMSSVFQGFHQRTYANDTRVMNSLIACALIIRPSAFVIHPAVVPYYLHCLVSFAQTIYGRTVLLHLQESRIHCNHAAELYQSFPDDYCILQVGITADQFNNWMHEELLTVYKRCGPAGQQELARQQADFVQPALYIKILKLYRFSLGLSTLRGMGYGVVQKFLSSQRQVNQLYQVLYDRFEFEEGQHGQDSSEEEQKGQDSVMNYLAKSQSLVNDASMNNGVHTEMADDEDTTFPGKGLFG